MIERTRSIALIVTILAVGVVLSAMATITPQAGIPVAQAQPAVDGAGSGSSFGGMLGPFQSQTGADSLQPPATPDCPGCNCNDSCDCPAPGTCVTGCGNLKACNGDDGGSNNPPPQPTHPPQSGNSTPVSGGPTPGATTVSGAPVAAVCGDGWCNGTENCVSCPRDCGGCYPTATPRPWDAAEEITYRCTPWDDCPSGWADVTVLYHRVNNSFVVVDVNCSAESECVLPTPAPQPTQPPQNLWPCNIPPVVESGMIRQPCDEWEGWYLQVEARIPPAGILRNPWPRGMVSIENCLWYEGAQDVEAFSAEKALPCDGVNYNRTYDNSVYDCGGETGQVTEGAQVNHQVGAAWRQWRMGDDPVFGYTPMHEVTWVVEDREWNGGDTMYVGNEMCHIYQTSSWGLPADGPTWNPECQDRTCDCDERVADYLGTESYHVKVETWWWPEYTFRYDEYVCADKEWSDCGCYSEEPHWTVEHRSCSAPPGICIQEGEWYGQIGRCDGWKWKQVQDEWSKYDLTKLGLRDPLMGWTGVTVAGADIEGNRCGEYTDRWPCYIPVPILELQPVGAGW